MQANTIYIPQSRTQLGLSVTKMALSCSVTRLGRPFLVKTFPIAKQHPRHSATVAAVLWNINYMFVLETIPVTDSPFNISLGRSDALFCYIHWLRRPNHNKGGVAKLQFVGALESDWSRISPLESLRRRVSPTPANKTDLGSEMFRARLLITTEAFKIKVPFD